MKKYFYLILVFLCSSCTNNQAVYERIFDYDSGVVDLSAEIEGDWDKVCLITPYFNSQLAEELIGFKFDVESKSDIYVSDWITLLLVIKDEQVVDYFQVPRNNIDFSSVDADCYLNGKAKFKIITKESNWRAVEPR